MSVERQLDGEEGGLCMSGVRGDRAALATRLAEVPMRAPRAAPVRTSLAAVGAKWAGMTSWLTQIEVRGGERERESASSSMSF